MTFIHDGRTMVLVALLTALLVYASLVALLSWARASQGRWSGPAIATPSLVLGLWAMSKLALTDPLPIWVLCAAPPILGALSFALWGWRRWVQPLPGPGCCQACGYDLRGSPPGGACPECGAGQSAVSD